MAVSGPMALSPECDAFREEFEALSAAADALVEPLSDEQFTWQPTPDSWSVALCIDHLNTTAREYLPKLDEGIANAIRRGQFTAGPYRYNWIGRLMVHVVKPTTRMRSKAPQVFVPTPGRLRPADHGGVPRVPEACTSTASSSRTASTWRARASRRR